MAAARPRSGAQTSRPPAADGDPAEVYAPPEDLSCREALLRILRRVRADTEALCAPLSGEDQAIQTMADVSPAKWHRAHTSWFFETFILARFFAGYRLFDSSYPYFFNSYYEQIGAPYPRARRGLLSRPGAGEIGRYREAVDQALEDFAARAPEAVWRQAAPLIVLGLHHEQQHQELILTDIKHVMAQNPSKPAVYPLARVSPPGRASLPGQGGAKAGEEPACSWIAFEGGLCEIGRQEGQASGFAFDNETPRHRTWLAPFRLAGRLATNGEYLAFMEDGGYERAEFWLADGWAALAGDKSHAPLYWRRGADGGWHEFTLAGERPLDLAAPVVHVSYYEASAYAAWAGKRLPREAESEVAAVSVPVAGNLGRAVWDGSACAAHPRAGDGAGLSQIYGDVWEWTMSAYSPYPGFRAAGGAIGEYNGKFMCGQYVLKGGSCATAPGHMRASYRNFFPPGARWQFSGIRLAEDG